MARHASVRKRIWINEFINMWEYALGGKSRHSRYYQRYMVLQAIRGNPLISQLLRLSRTGVLC